MEDLCRLELSPSFEAALEATAACDLLSGWLAASLGGRRGTLLSAEGSEGCSAHSLVPSSPDSQELVLISRDLPLCEESARPGHVLCLDRLVWPLNSLGTPVLEALSGAAPLK